MTADNSSRRFYAVLFPPAVRWKLGIVLLGSTLVSFVETASILLLLPLMQLLAGASPTEGALGTISQIFGTSDTKTLMMYLMGIVLGGFILKDAFTIAFRWWTLGFLGRQQVATSTHMLQYFLHAPYALHLRRGMPDMMRAMSDYVAQFYGRTITGLMGIVNESLTIITILGALVAVMPLETLAVAAYFGVASLLFSRWVKPRAEAATQQGLDAGKEAFEAIIHSFGGIAEIKIRHSQPHFALRYQQAATSSAMANRVSAFVTELPKYLLEVMFILGLGILIALVQASGSPAGLFATLALLAAAAFRLLPSMTRLLAAVTALRSGEPARKLLLTELAEEAALAPLEERETADTEIPLEHEIVFDDVWFSYDDGTEPVLRGVNFTVPAGSSVALVGGSGAGKTTVANLLLGLLRPSKGRILVDGVDIATQMPAWQNNIAFVPQDVFHMDLPFSQNIAFDQFVDEIDTDRLWGAIDQAQLRDLVSELPHGLDTTIGDHGVRLSGGQRQRIGIARALYRDPQLLVLDEATSALDNETERRITDTIAALQGTITIVVIAHRLSTVRDLDTIVVLTRGRVTGSGTFAELTETNAEFASMVALGQLDTGSSEAGGDDEPL